MSKGAKAHQSSQPKLTASEGQFIGWYVFNGTFNTRAYDIIIIIIIIIISSSSSSSSSSSTIKLC